jgi:pimeloyl-ACP methyl ester carboxylesterase
MMRMPGLGMPVLGVLGLEPDTMGWGTEPEDVLRYLPPGGRFVPLEGVGHFVHIEQPDAVASLVLDFLGPLPATPGGGWGGGAIPGVPAPPRLDDGESPDVGASTTFLRHARARLALHRLRDGDGDGATPLLLVHGLGERTPARPPVYADGWPGPVYGLDLTGHGASTVPAGGGYSAELLMADVDAALHHLGRATVVGRGLGAYVALLAAGARPALVRGCVLLDGPGMIAASTGPGASMPAIPDLAAAAPPDAFALAELVRDIRAPDYAAVFVRMALLGSSLTHPIAVGAVNRPPWLRAVVDEPGVLDVGAAEALAQYAEQGAS